jgi:hypothetical protein
MKLKAHICFDISDLCGPWWDDASQYQQLDAKFAGQSFSYRWRSIQHCADVANIQDRSLLNLIFYPDLSTSRIESQSNYRTSNLPPTLVLIMNIQIGRR